MINPQSSKAFYRSASALIVLERPGEAVDACERCLQYDTKNVAMLGLLDRALKARALKEKQDKERSEHLRRAIEQKRRLAKAYQVRALHYPADP